MKNKPITNSSDFLEEMGFAREDAFKEALEEKENNEFERVTYTKEELERREFDVKYIEAVLGPIYGDIGGYGFRRYLVEPELKSAHNGALVNLDEVDREIDRWRDIALKHEKLMYNQNKTLHDAIYSNLNRIDKFLYLSMVKLQQRKGRGKEKWWSKLLLEKIFWYLCQQLKDWRKTDGVRAPRIVVIPFITNFKWNIPGLNVQYVQIYGIQHEVKLPFFGGNFANPFDTNITKRKDITAPITEQEYYEILKNRRNDY